MAKEPRFSPAVKLSFAGGHNHNEDRAVCVDQAGLRLLAAFDGCGGVGGRRYPHLNNHTGAYLAAGLYARCLEQWFADHAAPPGKVTADELTLLFAHTAARYQAEHLRLAPSAVTGSLVRTLPSTTVIALYNKTQAALYWAGDTRAYLLTEGGLRQLTADDLATPADAFASLYADAPIANYLCADRPFSLHETTVALPKAGILVLATDGAFHTLPTPMHFEALLLDTLWLSDSKKQWKKLLKEQLSACAADDVTLLLQPFGFAAHDEMRRAFDKRRRHVRQAYILPAEEAAPGNHLALKSLWDMYQKE